MSISMVPSLKRRPKTLCAIIFKYRDQFQKLSKMEQRWGKQNLFKKTSHYIAWACIMNGLLVKEIGTAWMHHLKYF